MRPTPTVRFSELMATFVTADWDELDPSLASSGTHAGLVVIKRGELVRGARCSIEALLHRHRGHVSTLGILGLDQTGRAVASRARLGFGMALRYHDARRAADLELELGARFLPVPDLLAQVDMLCVVLPLRSAAQALAGTPGLRAIQWPTVFLAWRRSPPVERAIAYFNRHYADCVHLDHLAATVGLSKYHLVRQFSSILGVTPHRYQLLLRVAHAKRMLRRGDGISQVGFCVGFSDQSHFSRCFRLIVGTTPGCYQRGAA